MLCLGIFPRGVNQAIVKFYVLGFVIAYFLAPQNLGERCLSAFTPPHQNQLFHYVFVIGHTVKPNVCSQYSTSDEREAETSEILPVTISVPLKRSTNPSSTPDDLIAISPAIIAVSLGDIVIIPIAAFE